MRQLIKKASRTNWMFISFFMLICLWAFISFMLIWPRFYWGNPDVKSLVCGLTGLSLIYMATGATHRYLRKANSSRDRVMWGIIANQLFNMGIVFLMQVGIILFITMINHAIS